MRIDDSEAQELLAGKVLGDLVAEEQAQLKALEGPESVRQLVSLERAAAAVHLTMTTSASDSSEQLPDNLRQQIALEATKFFAEPSLEEETHENSDTTRESEPTSRKSSGFSRREAFAWLLVAASLLLAFGLWNQGNETSSPISLTQLRSDLVQADGTIEASWGAGPHAFDTPVSGEVLWNSELQRGVMRFVDMPINDPAESQYQLWIIDPARDDEPIDGGVFDVAESGEILIPINAKLKVLEPAAFAITVEKPGGVVVSTQENLPLLAPVEIPPQPPQP